jgi:hypothetical protein
VSTGKQVTDVSKYNALIFGVRHSVRQSKKKNLFEFLDPEDVGCAVIRNVGNHSEWCDITEHLAGSNTATRISATAVRCHNVPLG